MSQQAIPLGGPIVTRPFRVLVGLFGLSIILLAWRFWTGLGSPTALSDGYPWGLWIAFDVVTGTALACGGYAMAILVYIFNRGRYHPLIRPAIVTSALGYSLGGIGVIIDLGRYWYVYKVPINFWIWNLNSILLEVALCIMAYTVVLWIELSPAFLERWKESPRPRLRRFAESTLPWLERSLIWIIALGLLLPTMHQSSLGSLMLLAGHKLHPLWNTALLPLLFLISCIAMGYAVVVIESSLSSMVFKRPAETRMLASLSGAIVWVLLGFAIVRLADLAVQGRLGLAFALDSYSILFLLEMALFIVPAFMLLSQQRRSDGGYLFRAAMLIALSGALYRFSTYLIAYDPGPGWSYFPAVPEILITLGLLALELMAYLVIVKKFPILRGMAPSPSRP